MNSIDQIINQLLADKCGERVLSFEPQVGGLNSYVYKVVTDRMAEYFAKQYKKRNFDASNRLFVEYDGMSFLWDHGIRAIPEPICCDRENSVGIYRFVNGKKIKQSQISQDDVRCAAQFICLLNNLAGDHGSEKQPIAAEACFSIQSYFECIEERLSRLQKTNDDRKYSKKLFLFLDEEFVPLFRWIRQYVQKIAKASNIDMSEVLDLSGRTLSPSDFGFHNVLKLNNGSLIFIDFEYFGWDDPAKLISDFYLQPAIPLLFQYREFFLREVLKDFVDSKNLLRRLPIVYMLLSMKWILIMLNPFLPSDHEGENSDELCLTRLKDVKKRVDTIKQELSDKTFPISLMN